jgi:tetratricopeptide (TPR) repeat protein
MSNLQLALQQAWATHQAGNVAAAESVYRQILAQQPRHAATHVYLGLAHFDQRRFGEAAQSYRQAIQIQPDFPIAWNNLGNAMRMLGEFAEADECFTLALRQKPDYLSPMKNRGTLWIWAGEVDRGLASYQEAMRIAPDDPELHRNLGVIYLLQQRYEEGWPEYRWRWHMNPGGRPNHPSPVWQGEAPAGKTFLLYPEQGIGDAIHFARAAQTLKQAGGRTVLQCAPKLVPLMSSITGIDLVVPEGMAVEQFGAGKIDYQASLIDVIDRWYGRTGTLATTFAPLGHRTIANGASTQVVGNYDSASAYLQASDSLVDYWRRVLFPSSGGDKRVGICWQGNVQFHADIYRSVPLEKFAPLAKIDGVSLLSLQHGLGREQIETCSFGNSLAQLPDSIDQSSGAFLDTAAIIRNLDLVITVDTSTGHLAAALGKPVWVVLGSVPDWRWTLQGDTSAWYPTVRLFRQQTMGQWDEVFLRMAAALATGQ